MQLIDGFKIPVAYIATLICGNVVPRVGYISFKIGLQATYRPASDIPDY